MTHELQEVKNTWNYQDMTGWHSSVLVQNDYSYNDAGNRMENDLSDSSGPLRSELYDYDELNRLTSVDYGDGETQAYTFDNMGNRLSKSDTTTSTVSESYTYNNANMLLTRGSNSYTNDANGNTLTGGGRSNTWDGENRLTQCVFSGTTTTHTYGSDGYRHQTVNGTNTTDFILDGDNAVRTNLNGTVNKTYLHGARGPEYERIGTADPDWYLYDGLGSVLGTVSPAGVVTHTRKYDVYGAVRGSTGGSGTDHKWCGSLGHPSEDETGLVYMRARYYDPVCGRFESQDTEQRGSNWLCYANSSPVGNVDRDGKSISSALGGVLIGIGVAVLAPVEWPFAFVFLAAVILAMAVTVLVEGGLMGLPMDTVYQDERDAFYGAALGSMIRGGLVSGGGGWSEGMKGLAAAVGALLGEPAAVDAPVALA